MDEKEILKKFLEYYGDNPKNDIVKRTTMLRAIEEAKRFVKMKYGDAIPEADTVCYGFYKIANETESVPTFSDFCQFRTVKEIEKNPGAIIEIYKENMENPEFWRRRNRFDYTLDRKENLKLAANDFYVGEWTRNGMTKEESISKNTENKIKSKSAEIAKRLAKQLIDRYANGIADMVYKLYKLGILYRQVEKNNSERSRIGLEVLNFNLVNAQSSDRYSIDKLTDIDFLKTMPFEKLVLLYAYYSNRLKKVEDSIGAGLFVCSKINDFDVNRKPEYTDEVAKAYSQYKTIEKMCSKILEDNFEVRKYLIKGEDKGGLVKVNSQAIYNDRFAVFEKAYSSVFGNDADLRKDFMSYMALKNIGYAKKDFALKTVLIFAMENLQKSNWGYISEEEEYGKNSILAKRREILLGFDSMGFNMPIRLHMPLEMVRYVYKMLDQSYEIPNYIGDEDFSPTGNNIGASIIGVFSPQHRKHFISTVKKMNPSNPYYPFARHIECMQYENNLARLQKWKDPNGRKTGRTYTNLETGKEIEYSKGRI